MRSTAGWDWSHRGVVGTEFAGDDTNAAGAVVMFQLQGGLILALYPRTELVKDANIPPGPPGTGEFSIGHAVASKADVDPLLDRAEKRGRHADSQATPASLGHLLRLLQRPRRPSLGNHMESPA